MGLLNLFKKAQNFFTVKEQEEIVEAIRKAELHTSGEVRIYIESKNAMINPLDRAGEIFFNLKMEETEHRNAVLIYIATKDHELAIFGDEGIYQAVGASYWNEAVSNIINNIDKKDLSYALQQTILAIGKTLAEKFPYISSTDKNELPDDIVFGH